LSSGRWERVKLSFAAGLQVEFSGRGKALRLVEELADRGTGLPLVVFGPEGCGKTAFLVQARAILESYGYSVLYVSASSRRYGFIAFSGGLREVVAQALSRLGVTLALEGLSVSVPALAAALLPFELVNLARREKKVALLIDDVFQAIGLDEVEGYVKTALNLIEYPPWSYERIAIVMATSEGVSRGRIGRHRWAALRPMWNMDFESFKELYRQIPGYKPPVEDAWRLTGGNPSMLKYLYMASWRVELVVRSLAEERKLYSLASELTSKEREGLELALEDPDVLFHEVELKPLLAKLVEANIVIDGLYERTPELWVDTPPPERDLEAGIGRFIAWQTPLHREAVRQALQVTPRR